MIGYDRLALEQDIRRWLGEDSTLSRARRLLGGQGLGDTKIANWKRRELPEALVEGAALEYCARATPYDAVAARLTGLAAGEFWQLFFVSADCDSNLNHHCTVYRYWSSVRLIDPQHSELPFVHKSWFTGSRQHDPILNVITGQPHEDLYPFVTSERTSTGQRKSTDGPEESQPQEIAVAWRVSGELPCEIGYRVCLKSTFATKPPGGQRHEYLGGLSIIPVERSIIVAVVPTAVLMPSQNIFDDAEVVPPLCIRFLSEGAPILVIEHLLQDLISRKWLAPWFANLGPVQQTTLADIALPATIEKVMRSDKLEISQRTHSIFWAEVMSPAPYLHYSMVFELRRSDNG
jgi:hypothetical protein